MFKLFPRENLIENCKRLTYLGEILSPTLQNTKPGGDSQDPGLGPDGHGGGDAVRRIGTFYWEKYVRGGSCDTCKNMKREAS